MSQENWKMEDKLKMPNGFDYSFNLDLYVVAFTELGYS